MEVVKIVIVGIIGSRINIVVVISWISRWFVVRFVVSCIFKVNGWINKLIVLIIIRVGINGMGVFFGKRCFRVIVGWFFILIIIVVSYRGIVNFIFRESWVVGVKV